ncbi:MAG TPA: hypothetical protein VEQ60_10950, partial [Longimicrobium sp.]|nr:hypothetical protein [Longimicrobium sp.]
CGEAITLYPPGIPLICPGERLTGEVLRACARAREADQVFARDPTLATISVIDDRFTSPVPEAADA